MAADDLASTLTGIKALIAERDALAARINWAAPDDIAAFNAAQDKVAGRVPSLVAALEDVLSRHVEAVIEDMPAPLFHYCKTCDGHPVWPCPEVRAITTALTGKEAGE